MQPSLNVVLEERHDLLDGYRIVFVAKMPEGGVWQELYLSSNCALDRNGAILDALWKYLKPRLLEHIQSSSKEAPSEVSDHPSGLETQST